MLLSTADWAAFRQAINDASATFNNESIIWKHLRVLLAYDGNDDNPDNYEDIPLSVLVVYNVYPSWPIDKITEGGVTEKDSLNIIINRDYLSSLGRLNSEGMMDLNLSGDYFILKGINYRIMHDTQGAQAYNDPILQYITLVRDFPKTGIPHL